MNALYVVFVVVTDFLLLLRRWWDGTVRPGFGPREVGGPDDAAAFAAPDCRDVRESYGRTRRISEPRWLFE